MGTPWPGLLTCMGWGSMPSWLQRSTRGRPKRRPVRAEPDGPGASAAAEVPGRTKRQGSHLLLLLRAPPSAKEKRAKRDGAEVPGQRSWTLERTGEVSFGNEGSRGLRSLLPQSNGDRRALREGQQQPQCSLSARPQEEEGRAVLP